jgi:putative transposase
MAFTQIMVYTTDLTVPQFELLEQLLPQSQTYKNVISRHDIINAIFYQLKNGCQWRDLPSDFPNWQTVYSQFRRWQLDGTWQQVLAALAREERGKVKKTNLPVC